MSNLLNLRTYISSPAVPRRTLEGGRSTNDNRLQQPVLTIYSLHPLSPSAPLFYVKSHSTCEHVIQPLSTCVIFPIICCPICLFNHCIDEHILKR